MSMLQKIITSGTTPTYPSMWYQHDTNWTAKTVVAAADRYTLQSPDAIQVDVGGTSLTQYSKQMLDLSLDTNWDFGQGVGTWTAEHTYAVGDLVRQVHSTADGAYNLVTAYVTTASSSATAPYPITVTTESGSRYGWEAFNQTAVDTGDQWRASTSTGNIMIDLGSIWPKVINKYAIMGSVDPSDYATCSPKNWQLQGTNTVGAAVADAESANGWTTLDSRTDITYSAAGQWSAYFTFSNTVPYRYYRLRVTANNGSGNLDVGEVKLVQQKYIVFRASAITTGISNSTEPSWAVSGDTTDSGVTWTAYTDYTVAQNRAGQDFYVYSVARSEGSVPKLICSANATYPINYNASTSRKIAGFHCLCNSVGTVAGNSLTGYVTGDILPLSVWDVHRKSQAVSGNVGQVYNPETGKWAGIYPVSGSKTAPTIVYGGTILVSTDWNDAVDAGKVANMFLPSDAGFQSQAAGSNEQTNIYGSAMPSPATTIGYVDTAGTRMISNIGCESCCGLIEFWLDEQSYRFDAATAHNHALVLSGEAGTFTSAAASADVAPAWGWQAASGSKGSIYKQGTYGDVKVTGGGMYGDSNKAGSRSRVVRYWRWASDVSIGFRLIANSIEK